jgi:Leucine-rich repeat (LRR) protein
MDFKFIVKEKLKPRYCFKCNKPIDYGEFYHKNFKSINEINLVQFWQNEKLEYYCCLCYDELMKMKKLEEIRLGLNERDRDILRILEAKLNTLIPIVPELKYNTIGVTVKNGNIVGLSLFKCLSKFPEEITIMGALEKLNLSWNSLEFIPESIASLTSLKFLE